MLKTFRSIVMVFASIAIVLGGVPAKAASLPLYSIKDLGIPSGNYTNIWPAAVNNQGIAVGSVQIESDLFAVVFQNNTAITYGTASGQAADINDSGLIVGAALDTNNQFRGTTFQSGSMQFLSPLPGDVYSAAVSVNSAGSIVGISGYSDSSNNPVEHAVIFQSNLPVSLGALAGDDSSWAVGINDTNTASGTSFDHGSQTYSVARAVIYKNGTVIPVDTTGSCYSFGGRINNSERVSGYIQPCDNPSQPKPVIFSSNPTVILPLPEGDTEGIANSINNAGLVVGNSSGNQGGHATLYTTSTAYKLSDLVINSSGWTLEQATDINDSGQIVGTGYYNGQQRAFLLTPIVPINSLLVALGLPPISLPPLLP